MTPDEIIYQLECVKKHIEFVAEYYFDEVKFDVAVLDTCISAIRNLKEENTCR